MSAADAVRNGSKLSLDFANLYAEAEAAGMAAGEGCRPAPMVVVGGVPGEPPKRYYEAEGMCGFAWVVIFPGNAPFANWCKKHKGARAEYGGGCCVKWVGEFNQSADRKEAYARAFAKVLRDAGLDVSSRSRLD